MHSAHSRSGRRVSVRVGRRLLLIVCLTNCGLGCGGERRAPDSVPTAARRVAALTCSAVDVFGVLGAMDAVVAVEEDCPLPEAAGKFRIRNDDLAGRNRAFNVEALLGVSPDAVVAKRDLAPALEPLHVRLVWSPAPPVIDAVPEYVMSLARLVGKEDAGRAACATFAEDMARVRARCEGLRRVRVYYESTDAGRSAGRQSVAHAMIELCGGLNIAGDLLKGDVRLSTEAIVRADPEVIVLGPFAESETAVAGRAGFDRTTAVRRGRLYRIPKENRRMLLTTPRAPAAAEQMLLPWLDEARGAATGAPR